MNEENLTLRKRVELALQKKNPGGIPFVIWNNKIPDDNFAEKILDAGACIIVKSQVYNTGLRSIEKEETVWNSNSGQKKRQVIYHTPAGDIEETFVINDGIKIQVSYPFKEPKDYDAVFSLVDNWVYTPCYDKFISDDKLYGKQGLARTATERSPFFQIIYQLMGLVNFSIEWHENRKRVQELHKALIKSRKKRLAIVADSPARYCVVDGNIDFNAVGSLFDEYHTPDIIEACEILKPEGIITGLHLDANNKALLNRVSELPADVIESFTPPPDCDTTLTEGLKAWPDKAFIVNFPSSLHLSGAKEIRKNALSILNEGKNTGRVIIGITENVPHNELLLTLAQIVEEES